MEKPISWKKAFAAGKSLPDGMKGSKDKKFIERSSREVIAPGTKRMH
jgi:hypothetical protein